MVIAGLCALSAWATASCVIASRASRRMGDPRSQITLFTHMSYAEHKDKLTQTERAVYLLAAPVTFLASWALGAVI